VVSENGMLGRLSAPNQDEIRAGWKKIRNGFVHNLYSYTSKNIIRVIK
jgi:hypothetical protein